MRKIISYILLFVMTFLTPVQSFSQGVAYKRAADFNYDIYASGETNKEQFIMNLEADLNTIELNYKTDSDFRHDLFKAHPSKQEYYHAYGTREKLKEAYNDFLYFNMYPEKSPYWKLTSLDTDSDIQDGQYKQYGEALNVLHILDYYEHLTKDIARLSSQNPVYKEEQAEKWLRKSPTILILTFLTALNFIITDGLMAGVTAPAVVAKLAKAGIFVSLMGLDIFVTDLVAYKSDVLSKRLNYLVNSTGFYKQIMIQKPDSTNMFKPLQDQQALIDTPLDAKAKKILKKTWFYRQLRKFSPNYRNAELDKEIDNAKSVVDFFEKRKITNSPEFRYILAGILKEAVNNDEYTIQLMRQEMLRLYYALRFVRAELADITDPLRYNRAMIDLATIYKVMYIQILDNRITSLGKQPEYKQFSEMLEKTKGVNHSVFATPSKIEKVKTGNIQKDLAYMAVQYGREDETKIGADLNASVSTYDSYPTLLPRAEVNYLVQIIDIEEKDEQKKINEERLAKYLENKNKYNHLQSNTWLDKTNLNEKAKQGAYIGGSATK